LHPFSFRKRVISDSLGSRRVRAAWALVCATAAMGGLAAQAEGTGLHAAKAQVSLRTVVAASFRVIPLAQPVRLEVNDQDIARGFVDLPRATSLQLASNTGNSFSVAVAFDPAFIAKVAVRMLDDAFVAGMPGAAGFVRNAQIGKQHVLVSYRVYLSEKARAGTYPWPIGLSFSALL
jgi:hypothetical protein